MYKNISVEERIKKAEEIYKRRRDFNSKVIKDNKSDKKDIRVLKKLIVQVIICSLIYVSISNIYGGKYNFSNDVINKTKEILSYNIDINNIFQRVSGYIDSLQTMENEDLEDETNEMNNTEESVFIENVIEQESLEKTQNVGIGGSVLEEEQIVEVELTQEEKDILLANQTTSFIIPAQGIITSRFGTRETTNPNIPENHTGTDIGATTGTKIVAATDGEVVISTDYGDYGKHIKIQIGEVSTVYAHCNELYVKQGDFVKQGQEIGTIGSTGNSTGPHLHFEIRVSERNINPEKILNL